MNHDQKTEDSGPMTVPAIGEVSLRGDSGLKTSRRAVPGTGVFRHYRGGVALPEFSVRPTFNRKRTWHKLNATTLKLAVIEARTVQPTKTPKKMAVLINLWLAAGCPGKTGPLKSLTQPKKAAEWLLKFFGQDTIAEVNRLARLDGYVAWRKKFIKRGSPRVINPSTSADPANAGSHPPGSMASTVPITQDKRGGCTVRMDLSTLSNILHFGTKMGGNLGFNDQNLIYRGRDRYHRDITHARDRRPENADVIHALALELFQSEKTEVHGWHSFFAMFDGCRSSENMRLRRDAATDKDAGFIRWLPPEEAAEREDGVLGFLYLGRRSKGGINPYAEIGPDFADMLKHFFQWHDAKFGEEAKKLPFFPVNLPRVITPSISNDPSNAVADSTSKTASTVPITRGESFGAALGTAARRLGLPHVTPHGYRSYFATKHRRDGKRSEEIASLMGDKTVGLVDSTYADNVKGEKLHWKPKKGIPAWTRWSEVSRERTHFGLKTVETSEKAI
jgi:integrase